MGPLSKKLHQEHHATRFGRAVLLAPAASALAVNRPHPFRYEIYLQKIGLQQLDRIRVEVDRSLEVAGRQDWRLQLVPKR